MTDDEISHAEFTTMMQWVILIILGACLGLVATGGYFVKLETHDTNQYLERLVFENRLRWSVADQRLTVLEVCQGIEHRPIP